MHENLSVYGCHAITASASSTAALGKTLPCRPHFTLTIKYDFKDACERLENLFIDKTALK